MTILSVGLPHFVKYHANIAFHVILWLIAFLPRIQNGPANLSETVIRSFRVEPSNIHFLSVTTFEPFVESCSEPVLTATLDEIVLL